MSDQSSSSPASGRPTLARELGILGLAATGICSMLGAGINVVPFMIQRNVPGIGPWVLLAFGIAVVPAMLAALCYAAMSAAMPRSGGSYVFVSRSVSPYLGFVASFSQWLGLSVVIGVVSYVLIPFFRDIATAIGAQGVAAALGTGPVRVGLALALLWSSVWVNVRGVKFYERVLVPLMFLMFIGGAIVIVTGASYDHAEYASALAASGLSLPPVPEAPLTPSVLLPAVVLLFASFIGFDAIAQAGGEARAPTRNLPLAIGIAIGTLGLYYVLFTWAAYHAVPWYYVAARAATEDVTIPGLLAMLLSPTWSVVILVGAAIALANDLPAMLLSVSRLMFAWAEDGVFPRVVTRIHPVYRTPWVAIVASAGMASIGILGSHLAGDFFLGIDIMVIAMIVNYLLVSLSVVLLPRTNPALAGRMTLLRGPFGRTVGAASVAILAFLLVVQVTKDLATTVEAWYFRSTWLWLIVMAMGTAVFVSKWRRLARDGDPREIYRELPPQ